MYETQRSERRHFSCFVSIRTLDGRPQSLHEQEKEVTHLLAHTPNLADRRTMVWEWAWPSLGTSTLVQLD